MRSESSSYISISVMKIRSILSPNNYLRCGTSIGANIAESIRAESKPDFYHKLNIALKEAEETAYWLELLYMSDYIEERAYSSISQDCEELIRLLVAITKTQKNDL